METEKKLRSLQREPGPGARRDLTWGTIYYKGYKMISPRVGSSKTGDVSPGSSLAVCPHQATGGNLYSRIVRSLARLTGHTRGLPWSGIGLAVELTQIYITVYPLARTAWENRLHRDLQGDEAREEMQNLKEQFLASSLPASRVPYPQGAQGTAGTRTRGTAGYVLAPPRDGNAGRDRIDRGHSHRRRPCHASTAFAATHGCRRRRP